MTLSATNFIVRQYLKTRQRRIQRFIKHPYLCQAAVLQQIIEDHTNTQWGKMFNYAAIKDKDAYRKHIPVQRYEDVYPWIHKMIDGQENILTSGAVNIFSKSSGTSNDVSKYIPVSKSMLSECHDMGGWDLLTVLYQQRPDTKIFINKNLIMAGSVHRFDHNPSAQYGDISAITLNKLPPFSRPYYTPEFETALLDNWEEKIHRMVEVCSEENLAMIAGVPSWTLILFQKMIEHKGVQTMEELWPEASIYFHGGVGFDPYRKSFDALFPSGKLEYLEVYNASEGFFAIQNNFDEDDLLLLLDHGIYYEFIPEEQIGKNHPETILLRDVEVNKTYGLVITTLSGLSRYRLGDTIKFTSTQPYKIKVIGREQQYINAFGEELMVYNAEIAIAQATNRIGVNISNYTVAPQYIDNQSKGAHQWLIEFEKEPDNIAVFERCLDLEIQKINSDYKAKRSFDLALENLNVTSLPKGTFHQWLSMKGKLGGQNKIPRLSNDRKFVEEILSLINQ